MIVDYEAVLCSWACVGQAGIGEVKTQEEENLQQSPFWHAER